MVEPRQVALVYLSGNNTIASTAEKLRIKYSSCSKLLKEFVRNPDYGENFEAIAIAKKAIENSSRKASQRLGKKVLDQKVIDCYSKLLSERAETMIIPLDEKLSEISFKLMVYDETYSSYSEEIISLSSLEKEKEEILRQRNEIRKSLSPLSLRFF